MPLEFERNKSLERSVKGMEVAVTRGLVLSGQILTLRAVAIHKQERPGTIATGQTVRSHTASPVKKGTFKGKTGLMITVGPRTKYAKWGIGSGRPPGTPPPLLKLIQWLREKPDGASKSARDLHAMAQAVQRTIKIFGTKEYRVLERALAAEKKTITRVIATSVHAMYQKNAK